VAHACDPSYSEDRDQDARGLKPAQKNILQNPISKKPITKKENKRGAGGVAPGIGPEFNPQHTHKKKEEK
jgi:hypothetical protein